MSPKMAFIQATPLLQSSRCTKGGRCMVCMCDGSPKSDAKSALSGEPNRVSKKPIKTIKTAATWANVFLPEFGSKGAGSRPDWDLRPLSIRNVEGGKDICDSCKGTGTMTCSLCMGLDYMSPEGKIQCPACKGMKGVTCSACFGSKKQVELTGNWWERGVATLYRE